MQCRAITAIRYGGPEVLQIQPIAVAAPGPGELRVSLYAYGVNYVDVLMVRGGYQLKPQLPFVPGLEAAGEVVEVGRDVLDFTPGQRVMTSHRPGAFAEQVCVSAAQAYPLPDSMTFEQGAAFRSAHYTAWHSLYQQGGLRRGESVLVHGATGGVGLAAVQVAKLLGATVIATGTQDNKLKVVAAHGADHVLNIASGSFRDPVKELTGGKGVDVVYDPIGGQVFNESTRCLAWGARVLVIGFVAGEPALAKTNHILIKGASVIGVRAGEFGRRNPEIRARNMAKLMSHAAAGELSPHISHRFEFAQVREAFEVIDSRQVIGKAVLSRSA